MKEYTAASLAAPAMCLPSVGVRNVFSFDIQIIQAHHFWLQELYIKKGLV